MWCVVSLRWGHSSPAHIAAAEQLLESELLSAVAQITLLCSAEVTGTAAAAATGTATVATAAALKRGSHATKLRLHAELARVS